jgi:CheY-like chemotaxis protein
VSAAIRVLLVEDDVDSAEALGLLLQRSGYAVRAVDTAREALAVLAGADRPDVMLLDLTLRDLSGAALLDAFRGAGRLPPTILTSAATEPVLRAAAHQLQSWAALRKPYPTDALMRAVANAAAGAVRLV